jgi:DNA invertase Pin-like site-specific DNA recombinase
MALVGYARVSTQEQHPEGQTDALTAAGCDKLFVEHASGVLARRPALDDALAYLRDGDTLVVTKLDGSAVR